MRLCSVPGSWMSAAVTAVSRGGLPVWPRPSSSSTQTRDNSHARIAGRRAVEKVIRKHLLALQAVDIFRLRWYFRTLAILEQTLAEDWTGTDLPASVRGRLTNVLNAHPNAQIAVTETFRLNVLRKR